MALKYNGWYAFLSLVVLSSPCLSKPAETTRTKASNVSSQSLQLKTGENATLTKTHHGKLIIGRSSRQDDVRSERKAANRSLTMKVDYQADMGWEEPELVGVIEKQNSLEVDQLLKMEPKVECTGSSMRLKVAEGASTPGSIVFVDRGKDLSPLPLSKLPPSCGYTTTSALKNLVLVAPYDGCFVIQEEGNYVLPLRWSGMQVRMSCPTIRPFASNPPMVTCHDEGMVLKIEWVISVKNIKVNLNGHWEPLMSVSSKCGFSVVAHPEGVVLSIRYAPCLEMKEGMFTLELAGEGEIQVSCPSNLISGSKSPKQPMIEMDTVFPSYQGSSHSFDNLASQTLYTQAPVDGLWYPDMAPLQGLQDIHGKLSDSGKQDDLFGPQLAPSTVQHHASDMSVTQQPEQGIPAVLIGEAQLPSYPYSFYPGPPQINTLLSEKLSEEGLQTRYGYDDQDRQPVGIHPFYTQLANSDVPPSKLTHYTTSSENQDLTGQSGYPSSTSPLYPWLSTHDTPALTSQSLPQTAPVSFILTPESGGEQPFFPYAVHAQAPQNEMLLTNPSDNIASPGQGHFFLYSPNPTYEQEAGLPSNQRPSEMGIVHPAEGGQEKQPVLPYHFSQLPTQGNEVPQEEVQQLYLNTFYTSPDGAQVPATEASPGRVHQPISPYEPGPSTLAPSNNTHGPPVQLQNAQTPIQPVLTYPPSSVHPYLVYPQQPLDPEATTHPLTKKTAPVAQVPEGQINQPYYLYPFYTHQPEVLIPETNTLGLSDENTGSTTETQDYPPMPFYPYLFYPEQAQGQGTLPHKPYPMMESGPQSPTDVPNIQVHEPSYSHPFYPQLQHPLLVNQPTEKISPATVAPGGQVPQLYYPFPFYHQQPQAQNPGTDLLTAFDRNPGLQILQPVDNTSTHLEYPYSHFPFYPSPFYSQQPSKLESERDPSKHSVKKPGPPNNAPINPLHLYLSSSSHQPQDTKDSANLPGHDSQKTDQATGHQRYQQSQNGASLLPGSSNLPGLVIPGPVASHYGTSPICPQICPTGFVNCCPPSFSFHQHVHHIVPANTNGGFPFYTGHPLLPGYSAFHQANSKTSKEKNAQPENSEKGGSGGHNSQTASQPLQFASKPEIPLYFQSGPIARPGSDSQKNTEPRMSTDPSLYYDLPHSLWPYNQIPGKGHEGQQTAQQPPVHLLGQSQDFSNNPSISQAPGSDPVQPYYIYDFQMKDTPPNEQLPAKEVQPAAKGLSTTNHLVLKQDSGSLATSVVPYHMLHNPDHKGHSKLPDRKHHNQSSSLPSVGDLQKPMNSSMGQYLEPQGYVLLQHGPPGSDATQQQAKSPNEPSGPSAPVYDPRSSNLLWLLTGKTQQPQDLGKEITGSSEPYDVGVSAKGFGLPLYHPATAGSHPNVSQKPFGSPFLGYEHGTPVPHDKLS